MGKGGGCLPSKAKAPRSLILEKDLDSVETPIPANDSRSTSQEGPAI